MAKFYQSSYLQLEDKPLSDEFLTAVGKIVRVCAEIEDCVDLGIQVMLETSATNTLIMLGRTPITRKIDTLETLAKAREDDAEAFVKKAIISEIRELIRHRNVVAHGVYVGCHQTEGFAFVSSDTHFHEDKKMGRSVFTYTTKALLSWLEAGEQQVPKIERLLKIQTLRESHRAALLHPHPKAGG